MNANGCLRRAFLKSAAMIVAMTGLPGCILVADRPNEVQPFTFVQICDPQLGFGGYDHDIASFQESVRQINELDPDFVVICGDLVNAPDDKSYADFLRIKAGLTPPCHCAPGNHDVGNAPTRVSLNRYRQRMGEDYYSFEHKGCTFVIVNTQLWKTPVQGESDKHDRWFEATLKTASEKGHRIFVVGHHPLFLEDPSEDDQYYNLPLETRKRLLRLCETRNVVAVLAGHTHNLIVNDYKGIQLVNAEPTSKNFEKRPLGFRLWRVEGPGPFEHDFVPLRSFYKALPRALTGKLLVALPDEWRFRTDPQAVGERERWFDPAADLTGFAPISVAKSWEQQGVGPYDGYAWYVTDVVIPETRAKRVWLLFMAVDEHWNAWIDGKYIGANRGAPDDIWDQPSAVEITGKYPPGRRFRLAVQVHDSVDAGGIWQAVKITTTED